MVVIMSDPKAYAVIDPATNIVVNTVVLNDASEWPTDIGTYVVCTDGTDAGIGWKFENNSFVDVRPVAIPEEQPTE